MNRDANARDLHNDGTSERRDQRASHSNACILCGRKPGPGDYWTDVIVRCPCGLVYTDQSRAAPPEELYQSEFFEGSQGYFSYEADKPVLQRNFRHHLDVLAQYHPSGNLFEIGCAYGFCLELARERWTAAGIDISEHAAAQARKLGLNAAAGSYLEHPLPPESQDIICLWDTIEHLSEPEPFVAKASKELKRGGILALTTGDIGSLNARLRGKKWRLIHPTHFFYFSRPTMIQLLKRNGLEVAEVRTTAHWRSVANMANQIGTFSNRQLLKTLLFGLRDSPLGNLNIPLNLMDIMLVIARKP